MESRVSNEREASCRSYEMTVHECSEKRKPFVPLARPFCGRSFVLKWGVKGTLNLLFIALSLSGGY